MNNSYMTRALRATDRRYARILELLGYGRSDMRADVVADPVDHDAGMSDVPTSTSGDEIAALRAEYKRVVGTRPFHGWSAEVLRERIAAAHGSQS